MKNNLKMVLFATMMALAVASCKKETKVTEVETTDVATDTTVVPATDTMPADTVNESQY